MKNQHKDEDIEFWKAVEEFIENEDEVLGNITAGGLSQQITKLRQDFKPCTQKTPKYSHGIFNK